MNEWTNQVPVFRTGKRLSGLWMSLLFGMKSPVRSRIEVVRPERLPLSHGNGRRRERLQILLQRLQVVRQLTVDALHLDEEVVGALIHLLHTSVDLGGK